VKADTGLTALAEDLKPYLRGERRLTVGSEQVELSAAILIPRDLESLIVRPQSSAPAAKQPASSTNPPAPAAARQIQYWSLNVSDPLLRDEVQRAVNAEVQRREYQARGLDAAAVQQVERTYVPFTSLNPKKERGQEAIGTADMVRQWAPSGFVYLLWVAIFSIMQMLLSNTIEEKSNRIVEVLLSSVTPGELMTGKLIGIAAIGLTMVSAWIIAAFALLGWKAGGASEVVGQVLVLLRSSNLVPVFAIYFLLGYLMYAAFILSIGSTCNTLKEAQSYMGVMTLILIVPLMTMTFIPRDPNGTLARLLSWIPLYTPFIMMNRATADPPLVDLIGTLVLLVASAAGALYLAGKIFRIGILRTGQPPKVLEMLRWALRRKEA
jgi:ABC-2 type transport system permease protein